MEMQDKEFDRLFRDKLEDLKIAPSRNLWPGIEAATEDTRRKRSIVPLLSIAASIIVLIAAGVLFLPKRPAIVKQQSARLAAKVTKSATHEPVASPKATQPIAATPSTSIAVVPAAIALRKTRNAKADELTVKQEARPTTEVVQQPVIANVPVAKPGSQPVVDTTTLIAAQSVQQAQTVKPAEIVAAVPIKDEPVAAPPAKKHRIHSFGDMLNVVIAAVDKRKDKVIEFSNTDGDEATITGINLGIIKVKKED
jgi:hypothetical protein